MVWLVPSAPWSKVGPTLDPRHTPNVQLALSFVQSQTESNLKGLQGQRELDKRYGQTTLCATLTPKAPTPDSSLVDLPHNCPSTYQYNELQ